MSFFLLVSTEIHSGEGIINGSRIVEARDNDLALTTIALMKKRDDFYDAVCTGSLIASNVVITSAHCVVGLNANEIYVLFGPTLHTQINHNDSSLLYSAREFIIHENYQGADDDIALIVLDGKVEENQRIIEIVNPAILENADFKINASGFSTYVDKTSRNLFDSFGINRERNYVEKFEFDSNGNRLIPLYTKEVFINRMASYDNILGLNQLDGGICPGDSGGPTTIGINNKNYLLGLNTSVIRKFLSNVEDFDCEFQSRSTFVYPYLDWIKKNVPGINLKVKELSKKEIKDNKLSSQKLQCLKSIETVFDYYNDEITFNYFLGTISAEKCQRLEVDLKFVDVKTNICFKECATFGELKNYCEFINEGNVELRHNVTKKCQ